MGDKVLVAYGSWCGSTADVAREIGAVLTKDGLAVDVLPAAKVKDLGAYRAVVLGTAVRAGRCKAEVTRFAQRHQAVLKSMPYALFSVGLQMQQDTPENRVQAESFLAPLKKAAEPVSVGLFGGAVDAERASFPMKLVIKAMPQGDWRNWDAVRAWAEDLRARLSG